jgi:NADPH:quinone reductase-like Zn-dependent oxidoreductase
VGGETLLRSLELMGPFGRTVIYGMASGEFADIPARSLFGMKTVAGFSLYAWRTNRPEQARAEMTEVAEYVRDRRLRSVVHATFPLSEVVEAHRLLDDRSRIGRVLVTL